MKSHEMIKANRKASKGCNFYHLPYLVSPLSHHSASFRDPSLGPGSGLLANRSSFARERRGGGDLDLAIALLLITSGESKSGDLDLLLGRGEEDSGLLEMDLERRRGE